MLLLRCLKFFHAGLVALLFVGISARSSAENHQREQAKESEKQHHADPRREGGLRLVAAEWFWRGHG
jgi:hypothetical protein